MLVACYSNVAEEALSVGSKLVNADKQRLMYLMKIKEKKLLRD